VSLALTSTAFKTTVALAGRLDLVDRHCTFFLYSLQRAVSFSLLDLAVVFVAARCELTWIVSSSAGTVGLGRGTALLC